eukprot:scaffold15939_cov86-Isochrysis_galbana.AAC.1
MVRWIERRVFCCGASPTSCSLFFLRWPQVDGEVDGEPAKVTKTKEIKLLGARSTAYSGENTTTANQARAKIETPADIPRRQHAPRDQK